MKQPSYYRARLKVLKTLQPNDDMQTKYLQNGFVPKELQGKLYSEIKKLNVSNEPLSFVEITSGSTWFAMHPNKIAGTEQGTTSFIFPVSVKGGEKDVKAMIKTALNKNKGLSKFQLEAEAIRMKLNLLKL